MKQFKALMILALSLAASAVQAVDLDGVVMIPVEKPEGYTYVICDLGMCKDAYTGEATGEIESWEPKVFMTWEVPAPNGKDVLADEEFRKMFRAAGK